MSRGLNERRPVEDLEEMLGVGEFDFDDLTDGEIEDPGMEMEEFEPGWWERMLANMWEGKMPDRVVRVVGVLSGKRDMIDGLENEREQELLRLQLETEFEGEVEKMRTETSLVLGLSKKSRRQMMSGLVGSREWMSLVYEDGVGRGRRNGQSLRLRYFNERLESYEAMVGMRLDYIGLRGNKKGEKKDGSEVWGVFEEALRRDLGSFGYDFDEEELGRFVKDLEGLVGLTSESRLNGAGAKVVSSSHSIWTNERSLRACVVDGFGGLVVNDGVRKVVRPLVVVDTGELYSGAVLLDVGLADSEFYIDLTDEMIRKSNYENLIITQQRMDRGLEVFNVVDLQQGWVFKGFRGVVGKVEKFLGVSELKTKQVDEVITQLSWYRDNGWHVGGDGEFQEVRMVLSESEGLELVFAPDKDGVVWMKVDGK